MEDIIEDEQTVQFKVTAAELRAFVERYERLEEEKKAVADQQKEVMAEAKGRGYDVRVIKKLVALRKREPQGAEAFLVATGPTAAMHEHASGQHGVILRTINIELQLLLGSLAIHDVELGFERGRDFGGSCHTLS